jgi:hypothetical protein
MPIQQTKIFISLNIQDDSRLLSGFPFIGHGNPDNNLESLNNNNLFSAKFEVEPAMLTDVL